MGEGERKKMGENGGDRKEGNAEKGRVLCTT